MSAALAQHASGTNFGTTVAATFTTATTAGRLLTCIVQGQQATDSTSVTDTAGNTWTKAASLEVTVQKHVELWYAVSAASCTTVTVALGATSINANMAVQEWSGTTGWTLRNANTASNASSTTATCTVACVAGDVVLSGLAYLEAVSGTRQDTLATGTALDALARGTTAFNSAYVITTGTSDGAAWAMSPAVSSAVAVASFGPAAGGGTVPVANAGVDQTVEPFTTVTLNSTATTGATSRAWTVVSNTSATTPVLSSTTATSPTFTAPGDFHTGAVITFRMTATNATGPSSDDVVVTVLPATRGLVQASGPPKALRRTVA